MKATGIVRRIDDLGRIVVPKEIRRTLRIREGDPLEIFTDKEGEIILKKYPNAIFTSDSAYYYYDLTDVIPDYFYLATKRTDSRINDKNVKQIFIPNELFDFGKTQIEMENIIINIYNEERMLVELIRKKNIMPFDYYKELITSYRKKSDKLDIYKIQEYISYYKNESSLYDTLMREVF